MMPKFFSRRVLASETAILVYLAAVKFILHMAVSGQYGIFRDELYYLAASKRLDFGYVDFPPLIAWLTAAVRTLLGDSLPALRLLPAVAGAGIVFLAGRMARELGAGKFGQALAAVCVIAAPAFLGIHSLLTMDSFEGLFWTLALLILFRLFRRDDPSRWLSFGLVAGISLLNKITFLYLGAALVAGLLLTNWRSQFRRWQLWAGGGFALASLIPYVVWNILHGFPTVEFWNNYGQKIYHSTAPEFVFQQILVMNPFTFPIWISGLVYFFLPAGKVSRPFGWMYLVLLSMFVLQGAKFYFLTPFYPVLFAAGARWVEDALQRSRLARIRAAIPAVIALSGLLLAPAAMPLLPLELEIRYHAMLSPNQNTKMENADTGILPQNLADQFGWEAMADTVAQVYDRLPAEDRASACIFAANYGEAGALEFFGPEKGLPPVISGHNSYFHWGPGTCTGETVLYIGGEDVLLLRTKFQSVEWAGQTRCAYCMPYENNLPIYICRGLRQPFEAIWPEVKTYL